MEKRDSGLISAFKALSIDVEIYLCKGEEVGTLTGGCFYIEEGGVRIC